MINLRQFEDDISLTSAIKASQIISQSTSNAVYDVPEASGMVQNRAYNGLNQDASIALISGYDASGNMINDGTRTLTYDVYNRLIRAQKTGLDARYDYDVEGRLQKVTNNGTVTTYRYFGVDRIAEYNAANVVLRRYVHGVGTDEPVVQFEGAGFEDKRYFVQNYQGSVVAMANTAGTVSALYKYGAYGEPYDVNGNLNWSGPAFRYTGQTVLEGAGLYHYKARVYDPFMGRFLQTDPIGSDDDINLYAYTGGDPINKTDPTGMMEEEDITEVVVKAERRHANHYAAIQVKCTPGDKNIQTAMTSKSNNNSLQNDDESDDEENFSKFAECLKDCAMNYYGLTALFGVAATVDGFNPSVKKPKPVGTYKYTSHASTHLRKWLPDKLPAGAKILGTRVVGGAIARALPGIGIAVTAYDAYKISECTNDCMAE